MNGGAFIEKCGLPFGGLDFGSLHDYSDSMGSEEGVGNVLL
jgi:hypothetical protein